MNCDDYLAMLSTLPVEEMDYGAAREHAARCRDCDRVTRVVAARERNMLLAYDDVCSSVPAAQVAANAVATSKRRRTAMFYKIGLGVATVAVIAYMVMLRVAPMPPKAPLATEAFHLQCLSPAQAAGLLRSHLQVKDVRLSYRPNDDLPALNVAASPEQLQTARTVLERYDDPAQSTCELR